MSRLLPLSSVVVHHGGLGTLSLALGAGVPQIVIPFGHDQFDNAARLGRLGVGSAITNQSNLPSRLTAAIEATLQNESLIGRSRALASEAQPEPAVTRICEQIEKDWDRWGGCGK
jgi:rhamnosyltransferase subunit B